MLHLIRGPSQTDVRDEHRLLKPDCYWCRGSTTAARLLRTSDAAAAGSAPANGNVSSGQAAAGPAANDSGSGAADNANPLPFPAADNVGVDVEELPPTFRQYYECAPASMLFCVIPRRVPRLLLIVSSAVCGMHELLSASHGVFSQMSGKTHLREGDMHTGFWDAQADFAVGTHGKADQLVR